MSSSDDQAAKVTEALRHLRGEPAQLVNTAGHPVPLAEGPGGGIRATTAPVGRVIVGPAQSVDPDTWGNVVYDQTMMTFASEITRDQQWPNPLEGARCYLMNQQRSYTRRNGVWRLDPLGFVATRSGPDTAFPGGGSATLLSYSMQALGGRRYLFEASCSATIIAGTGGLTPRCYLQMPSPTGIGVANYFLWNYPTSPPPAGATVAGYTAAPYIIPGLAQAMAAFLIAVGNQQAVAANAARLTVTELGTA